MTYVTVRTWQTQRKEMRKRRGNQEWLWLKRGPRWKGETHEGRRGGTAGGQWLPFKCHSMKQSSWVFFLKKRKSCVSFKLAAHVMETFLEKSVGLVIQKGKKKKWEAAWWKALFFSHSSVFLKAPWPIFFIHGVNTVCYGRGTKHAGCQNIPFWTGCWMTSPPLLPSLTPSSFLLLLLPPADYINHPTSLWGWPADEPLAF